VKKDGKESPMSEQNETGNRDMPVKDEREAVGDAGGIGGDARGRDTDDRMLADAEQRNPLFESTVADPEPLPDDLSPPEGIESLGQFSRDAAEPADRFIEDMPLDDEDVEDGEST
jgi:hypothetical protein